MFFIASEKRISRLILKRKPSGYVWGYSIGRIGIYGMQSCIVKAGNTRRRILRKPICR